MPAALAVPITEVVIEIGAPSAPPEAAKPQFPPFESTKRCVSPLAVCSVVGPDACIPDAWAEAWYGRLASLVRRNTIGVAAAVVVLVVAAVTLAEISTRAEIDLTRLSPTGETVGPVEPRFVLRAGRVVNDGSAPARNVEIVRPTYRLVGTVAAGDGFDAPTRNFSIRYEWTEARGAEAGRTKTEIRSFNVEPPREPAGRQVAGRSTAAGRAVVLEPEPAAPPGLTAEYDPVRHVLTVEAEKPVEVRVDGFLLRPVSRTEKDGAAYRYTPANVLVLGQDLKEGQRVEFEVVFTKPADFYSIPIYVRPIVPAAARSAEAPASAYFTVTVAPTQGADGEGG